MITALEIGAGLLMTGALVTMLMVLVAFELGRFRLCPPRGAQASSRETGKLRTASD